MWTTRHRLVGRATAVMLLVISSGCGMVRPTFASRLTEANRPTSAPGSTTIASSSVQTSPPPLPANSTEPPAVTGTRLQTADSETATEKAIDLTRKLNEADADRKRLVARVEELEASGKVKDQALDQARAEVQCARSEMARARQELEQWKLEITALREKLRGADEENLQTLQTAVSLLQQILSQSENHEANAAATAHSSAD